MTNERPLVFTVDGSARAAVWLEWALKSIRFYLGDMIRVFVCTDSPRDFGYGTTVVDVRPVVARFGLDRVTRMDFNGRSVPPMQIFRLALPIVPELAAFDECIFVDSDTEVLDSRWAEIFHLDISNCEVACVCDSAYGDGDRRVHSRRVLGYDCADIVNPLAVERLRRDEYLGAGMVVFNLGRIRKRCGGDYSQLLSRCFDLMLSCRFKALDQDAINLMFSGKVLPSRFHSWWKNRDIGEPVWFYHHAGPQKYTGDYPPDGYRRDLAFSRDILYVVGRGSAHDDIELKWSLRSIAKYGRNIGRVIVAGYPPCWLADCVCRIPFEQHHSGAARNILATVMHAVESADIRGEFLLSSDDHFYMQPVDFRKYPFYCSMWNLRRNTEGSTGARDEYLTCIEQTGDFLHDHDLPTVCFSQHCNSHWNAGLMRSNWSLFEEALSAGNGIGIEGNSVMCNLWLSKDPSIRVVRRADKKYETRLPMNMSGVDCFSIADGIFGDDRFRELMDCEFGEKCQYEK